MNDVVLETHRLILKIPSQQDFEALLALRTDPDVMRFMPAGIQTKEQVQEFIDNVEAYLKNYGFAFYCVYEKSTGNFIGQAGLFHLGFNVNQPDIELAYRLHKQYWRKGYATELAQALIQFGFEQFSLQKIVAVIHPDNDASRHVLQKVGMAYHGLAEHHGITVSRYEIINPLLNFNQIQLIKASEDDYELIKNMASYYVYDMSEYMKWPQEKTGTQIIGNHFEKYWHDANTQIFIIHYQDNLAGFVIIDNRVTNPSNAFNMAEFFILRQFKGRGLGSYVAHECFKRFAGLWEVLVMPGNEGAYRFWRCVIKHYTNHSFKEFTRTIQGRIRNIFEFSTKQT